MLTPIPILLHFCFSTRKSLVIGFAFLLGLILTLAQLMWILSIASQTGKIEHSHALIWSMVETNLGIVRIVVKGSKETQSLARGLRNLELFDKRSWRQIPRVSVFLIFNIHLGRGGSRFVVSPVLCYSRPVGLCQHQIPLMFAPFHSIFRASMTRFAMARWGSSHRCLGREWRFSRH